MCVCVYTHPYMTLPTWGPRPSPLNTPRAYYSLIKAPEKSQIGYRQAQEPTLNPTPVPLDPT